MRQLKNNIIIIRVYYSPLKYNTIVVYFEYFIRGIYVLTIDNRNGLFFF